MKFAFLLASVACGVAFSALGAILATGRIPFRPPPVIAAPAPAAAAPAGGSSVGSCENSSKAVGELMEAIRKEREEYEKKRGELTAREEELRQQQQILALLKTDIEKLQQKLDGTVVQIAQSEQVNFKRLAQMYSRMEPEGAAAVRRETEPERAAAILSVLAEREAGRILEASVASGEAGAKLAAKWSDIIRRMANDKGTRK
jgi:flagellar motility protein MotE (MotC chaperone)